jgi:peptidase A4-like protein
MARFSRLAALGATALTVLAACGGGPTQASASPGQPTAGPMAAPSAVPTSYPSRTASPAPSPQPLAVAVVPLVHCAGSASTVGGTSVHRNSTWAGYVAALPPGTFGCVEGSWIEPTVTCGSADAALAIWVGIGGYSSHDTGISDDGHALEKTGTGVDCENGIADHYAWHQRDPREPTDLPFPATATRSGDMVVIPGDRIWAQVRFLRGRVQMTVANLTSGDLRTVSQTDAGLNRSSSDWIVEGEDGLPVPPFASLTFTAGNASMAGTVGAIGSRAWLRNEIDEWAGGHKRLRASPLSSDGTSFSVTWLHA